MPNRNTDNYVTKSSKIVYQCNIMRNNMTKYPLSQVKITLNESEARNPGKKARKISFQPTT